MTRFGTTKHFPCGCERTPENTYANGSCRACRNSRSRQYYERNRQHHIAQTVRYAAWRRAMR